MRAYALRRPSVIKSVSKHGQVGLYRIPWYDHGMIKTTVSMTPELYSALTRAALDDGTNLSREIETHLRENPHIQKYIEEVRAEPDMGVHIVNPKTLRAKSTEGKAKAFA
jgi:hypothetical protein